MAASSSEPVAAPAPSVLHAEPAHSSSAGGGNVLPLPTAAEREAAVPPAGLDELDDLLVLVTLRALQDDACLLQLRTVSRRLQELADLVLEERFKARWGITSVVVRPPVAPAYAAPHPPFVLAVKLAPQDSLTALAVRHATDPSTLKRLNNLLSDHALAARKYLYIPLAAGDVAAGVKGHRVAFIHDTKHTQRRLVVVLQDGQELPSLTGGGGGSSSRRHPPASNQHVIASLARVLERALKVDTAEATFYVRLAEGDLRLAFEKFEEDRRWERVMRKRAARH